MSGLTLTQDQQNAYQAFVNFILDPVDWAFVLEGYAGTGKSTLVQTLIKELPNILKTWDLINQEESHWDVEITATTNKACEALQDILGLPVRTIHSTLGLRVETDWKTRETKLLQSRRSEQIEDTILFIDEASYIDSQLLTYIFTLTKGCKIVFIGDPAQLAPVKSKNTPVFEAGFTTATLTQVVRQAESNQIQDISTAFRNTVKGEPFPTFRPNQSEVIHLPRENFEDAIIGEFARKDWAYKDSKVLAWTNKTVQGYNRAIRHEAAGDPILQVGDYAICNSFISARKHSIKTDQLVKITDMREMEKHGIQGHLVEVDNKSWFFMPLTLELRKLAMAEAKSKGDELRMQEIAEEWIDLRAAYACTINKSQGSTFDRVYIDLDDLKRCNSGNQMARMLYVAVSRAREQVYLVGDVV